MKEKEIVETSEAEIAVHWGEESLYYPSTQFIAAWVTFRIALKNMPIFSNGMNTGPKSWIPAMHPAGNGLRAAR